MSGTEALRVLVVDDHMVVRAGLAQVFREIGGFEIVGEASSGEAAVLESQRLLPDVVVIDVMMPGLGGRAATKAILERAPKTRVIALSAFASPKLRNELIDAGASAFLSKAVSAAELVEAVRDVCRGVYQCTVDDRRAGSRSANLGGGGMPSDEKISLGDQQRRVLALLTKGFTNAEIATHIGVSMPTARYHVSAMLLKLGVSNRAEAAAWAIRNNLVLDAEF